MHLVNQWLLMSMWPCLRRQASSRDVSRPASLGPNGVGAPVLGCDAHAKTCKHLINNNYQYAHAGKVVDLRVLV